MTIGAWVGVIIIAVFCLGLAAGLAYIAVDEKSIGFSIAAIATVLIGAIICGVFIWYRCNSESGRRALKDQQSNLDGGINRTVSVYDINGDLIQQYSGKFDIETDKNSYILFDDENGNRHMIYYTTGTIIIDEN